jgi:general secretion pathway protein F
MDAPAGGKAQSPALADFIALNEEIAALVRARLPLEPHLARLGAELPRSAARLAGAIGAQLAEGANLAEAMDAQCGSLPAAYRAVIVAGVESGDLGAALESLVETATRLDQMRRITAVAILYPLLILVVACLLLGFVIKHVVPSFSWLRQSHLGPLAHLADTPWAISAIEYGVPGAAVLCAAIWWWRSGRVRGRNGSRWGALSGLPWFWRAHHWGQAATMAELLRLLIERGLPLERSLRLAADSTDDARIRSAAGALADEIEQGNMGLPARNDVDSVRRSGFPMLIRLALYHASNRELITSSLAQAASIYRDRAILAAQWYSEFLPILLTAVIGGSLTLGFALTVFWPFTATLRDLAQWNWR